MDARTPLKRKIEPADRPGKKAAVTKPGKNITAFFQPAKMNKPTTGPSTAATDSHSAAAFDKTKWADANLTAEQRELLQLEIDTLDESWFAVLKDHLKSTEFLTLKRFLQQEAKSGHRIFPPAEDVYSWSRHTPFKSVKVVILGQDPYHGPNQAHGLSFSVRPPTNAPPSLVNMFKALKNDYDQFSAPPGRAGHLVSWANQGVLMLNTCLTVRAHNANSHSGKGWEGLTQQVVDLIGRRRRGVVFLAWGAAAQKRSDKLTDMLRKEGGSNAASRHLVLKSVHPSPLSASRGFFTCGHFKSANEWLASRYGDDAVIDWNLTPGSLPCGPKKAAPDTQPANTLPAGSSQDQPLTPATSSTPPVPRPTDDQKENDYENLLQSDDDDDLLEVVSESKRVASADDTKDSATSSSQPDATDDQKAQDDAA